MAEKISLTVTPKVFTVGAGQIAEASATILNTGKTVDQFSFSIDGLEPEW